VIPQRHHYVFIVWNSTATFSKAVHTESKISVSKRFNFKPSRPLSVDCKGPRYADFARIDASCDTFETFISMGAAYARPDSFGYDPCESSWHSERTKRENRDGEIQIGL
jgi:hypothetical protein